MKRTPGPWEVVNRGLHPHNNVRTDGQKYYDMFIIDSRDEEIICENISGKSPEIQEANAKFIVRACNSHDELLEACKQVAIWLEEVSEYGGSSTNDLILLRTSGMPYNANILKQAISKAEGE